MGKDQEKIKITDAEREQMIKAVERETDENRRNEAYDKYVDAVTPKHSWFLNAMKAWLVGGIICAIGQAFLELYKYLGADKETAALYEVLSLVFLSVLLTGFHVYSRIAKFGGAGCIVPITGFANSVCAPAIEYQAEGQVFGIGCKIFTIAGPVILYGVFSSFLYGLAYWIWTLLS